MKPCILAITGPTASGKTALSLALADILGLRAEIICADSRQVYKLLDKATAKPNAQERAFVPHHLIDIRMPDEYYSAGDFARDATPLVYSVLEKGKLPIITGGSGLYVQALCEGFFDEQAAGLQEKQNMPLRAHLQARLDQEGRESLYNELEQKDPQSALLYSDMNPRRILRALEYIYATGYPFSQHIKEYTVKPAFTTVYTAIDMPRPRLYERINQRAVQMWQDGLIQETAALLQQGYSPDLNSLNTVGYKQALNMLLHGLPEQKALNDMQQATRNYAKRQITWNNRIHDLLLLQGNTYQMAQQLADRLKNNGNLPF
jgi:tRNA dimethylallyltransferase